MTEQLQSLSASAMLMVPPPHPATADLHPSSAQSFRSTLSSSPHSFLRPTSSLHTAAVVLAKRYLDPLAATTSEAHAIRLRHARKKRKRGHIDGHSSGTVLRLTQVHTEGFDIAQVWEQARRILDASRQEVERCLSDTVAKNSNVVTADPTPHQPDQNHAEDGRGDEEDISDEIKSDGVERDWRDDEMENDGEKDRPADRGSNTSTASSLADEVIDEEETANDRDSGADEESVAEDGPRNIFMPDKNGLNDGFFSIDDFNKQSGFLEQQDARGELKNDDASDEEVIDWDADPNTMAPSGDRRQPVDGDAEDQEESDEDDGPVFGNADLNAPDSSESGSELDGAQMDVADNMDNTNDIMYADFFAPPAKKASKATRRRALPKTQPPPMAGPLDTEDDIQRTIAAVRRDIFEDDEPIPSDDNPSDTDPSNPHKSKRSNHQTRQAKIAAEIRRLEAANVAKRDWQLSGEARAADRPVNSLLEEDLDFERAGKPVPVITNEVSEDIEALIKRRIIAREFDEVIRRRPGNLVTGNGDNIRRGRFELDDSKPQQSLAEIYETEHQKNAHPDTYRDADSEKLQRDTAVVDQLWKDINAQLESLCNFHYRPKPAQASISVVADVPAIRMEDARPSVGADIGGSSSMLAPQEVYVAGEGRGRDEKKREVVLKGGRVVGRDEMGQDERRRRRRREKERIRKRGEAVAGGGAGPGSSTTDSRTTTAKAQAPKSKKVTEAKAVAGALTKAGVRVIGKTGEVRNADGTKSGPGPKTNSASAGAGWKL
ncbi:U3 snoRNP protein [Pseudocyphellaria aurata]|nr:U3 snoRNP protein [Pseudocyphellaria aurata]